MTLLLVSFLLLDPIALGGEAPRAELEVTASGPGGGEDAGLADALAQALVDAGLRARRAREPAAAGCRGRCLRVVVRTTEPRRFTVEVRSRSEVSQAALQLDPAASSFDRAHALAIQVEMLTERARARRRPAARPAVAVAAAGPADAEPPEPASRAEAEMEAETAPPFPEPAPPADQPRAPLPSQGAPTVQATVPASATQPPQADARVALNVAALMLVGTSGGLFMHGSTVGARVLVGHRADVRAGISFLRPQNGSDGTTSYRRELLPLQLSTTIDVPHLPGVRAGGGVEAVLVSGDEADRDAPSAWSMGAIGRIEHRYAIRSFALMSSVQAAFHPPSWRTTRDPDPLLAIPPWILGVSLGLEFRIF